MSQIHYESAKDLIIIPAFIESKTHSVALRMVLDTGCANTIVIPGVLERLSIPIDHLNKKSVIRTAIGSEDGRLFKIKRFELFGRSFINHVLDCHSLPEFFQIDGLIGMDMLKMFKFTIDPSKKVIATTTVF